MKFIFSQMAFMVAQQSNRRNLMFMLKFFVFITVLVFFYSVAFHYIMAAEDRWYSPITGLYWTMTVMSTLGFGDITFGSDLGKVFTIVVLMSGILLFMLIMPFTFIRYVYAPWLDAQSRAVIPKELPVTAKGHVIIVGNDGFALSIVRSLKEYGIPYVLLVADNQQALELFDAGVHVMVGDLDVSTTYKRARADQAALVIALHDDMKNTNIAATLRETAPSVPLAARIHHNDSESILYLAGSTHVFHFAEMLGRFLARRVFNSCNQANIIGHFEGLCIAEAPAHGTPLVGKSLIESDIRGKFGLNVCGIWQGNDYMAVRHDTIIDDSAVLLLAGTEDMLARYDADLSSTIKEADTPVLILGGGTVAGSVARTLEQRGIPFRIVEKNGSRIPPGDDRYIHGSAADIAILRQAGLDETHTVVVTTHDDDVNIYLTIYCRKLRPEIQIISRASYDRNVASLYNAGANLVMSQSSMTSTTVINLLIPERVFMLTEGLNIFRLTAPASLVGIPLLNSGIRDETECNVIAIRSDGELKVPPDPHAPINTGDELILIASAENEKLFMKVYGK